MNHILILGRLIFILDFLNVILIFLNYEPPRLEICHDCHNGRSCKFFFKMSKEIPYEICKNIEFTHLIGKITHTFTKKLLNIYIYSFQLKKNQTNSYWNIGGFIVSKNSRDLHVLSV